MSTNEEDLGWAVHVEVEHPGLTDDDIDRILDELHDAGGVIGYHEETGRLGVTLSVYGDVGPTEAITTALPRVTDGGPVILVEAMTFAEQDRQLALPVVGGSAA